ncbi:MAG: nuclear transport factor 2 family protein, partial [Sphingomonadales bacterium]|nr:nuclear transport factor 2 family protein [Sphingomonadales bacterium]
MDRLERLEAIEAIRSLKARYFRLMDTKQWDELRGVFA